MAKLYVPIAERVMSLGDTSCNDSNGTRVHELDKLGFIEGNPYYVDTKRVYEVRWFKAAWMKYYEPDNQYSTLHSWVEQMVIIK